MLVETRTLVETLVKKNVQQQERSLVVKHVSKNVSKNVYVSRNIKCLVVEEKFSISRNA